MDTQALGEHWLLDLSGCPAALLDDLAFVRESAVEACRLAGATLLKLESHRFEPQGVTVVALVAESHLSIHTWPENNYAGVDIFTCGQDMTPGTACEYLAERFEASAQSTVVLERGAKSSDGSSRSIVPAMLDQPQSRRE